MFEEGTGNATLFLQDRVYCSFVVCVWLMNLLKELSTKEGEVVMLMVDNLFAINLAKNFIAHARSKHIEIRFHYLREPVSEENLRLEYCKSKDQIADLLTKEGFIEVFKRLNKHEI